MDREVAGGGMGVVFAGRQLRLDRSVAIKILRPEHATAVAAERFLAEGRLLAKLAHPNIVPIYDAGESDGLLYYVMEFVEGETLADRLKRGPLPRAEAIRLAQDLLAALSAAHEQGVVHRDVKPANIFLRGPHALLGDFGIARWRRDSDPGLTRTGQYIGTPSYMAPEQRDGVAATARSDVYSTGMVIYEACTGRRWPHYQPPDRADWSAVASALEAPVRRALALDPAERWPDATSFAAAIGAAGRPRRWPVFTAIAAMIGLLLWAVWPSPPPLVPRAALTLNIPRFTVQGPSRNRGLGDSVASELRAGLVGFPDFYVPEPSQMRNDSGVVRIAGTLTLTEGRLYLSARLEGRSDLPALETAEAPRGSWPVLVDTLRLLLLHTLWSDRAGNDRWIPREALPRSERGFAKWFQGEQYWARAAWEEAKAAYTQAEQTDTTCLLCSFRLLDIGRWLALDHDQQRLDRLHRELSRFPSHYQSLIHAAEAPLPARLDTLKQAADPQKGFFLALFEYGDELFHRGPLYGHLRGDAHGPFRLAVQLAPRFGPGWEHLLHLLMSEGDSATAAGALASLQLAPSSSGFSAAFQALLQLGYEWRFRPDGARTFSQRLLAGERIRAYPGAVAGARLLMTMDAPRGAVEVGGILASWADNPAAVSGGLLGQLYGYAALGWLDSVRATGGLFEKRLQDRDLPLLALELEAMLRAFDTDPAVRSSPSLVTALNHLAVPGATSPALRRRAAWSLGILAVRSGDSVPAVAREALATGPTELGQILAAAAAGAGERGKLADPAAALHLLPSIPSLDALLPYEDPLMDAVVHLLRAEWLERQGQGDSARSVLRWHEHLEGIRHGSGEPHAGELAWALGTLARSRRAQLIERMGHHDKEWCRVTRAVARLWKDAPAPMRVRADSARRAWESYRCEGPP